MFLGLISTFVEVTVEKLVRAGRSLPPFWIRLNITTEVFCIFSSCRVGYWIARKQLIPMSHNINIVAIATAGKL